MQKRLYDIGWSDEKTCGRLSQRRRHGEAQAIPLSVKEGSEKPDPTRIGERKSQRGIASNVSREGNWRTSHVTVDRWEWEKQDWK